MGPGTTAAISRFPLSETQIGLFGSPQHERLNEIVEGWLLKVPNASSKPNAFPNSKFEPVRLLKLKNSALAVAVRLVPRILKVTASVKSSEKEPVVKTRS